MLISCYELGHQPIALASAAAFLEQAGHRPDLVDLSVEALGDARVAGARFVGISVPMHAALRRGVRVARRIRALAPEAHVCFFGLYASLNARFLLEGTADSVIGGEFERPLAALVDALARGFDPGGVPGVGVRARPTSAHLEKLAFEVPIRSGLPGLDAYARLEDAAGTRLAAAVEASRGCRHLCRHCPIPPVYGGRFFVVPREVVLEDIRRIVRAGATHVTFSDPDFLNGPGHSLAIVRAMHEVFPRITFDFTAKVEHLLRHRRLLPEFGRCGCLFVVSAVESLNDTVLFHLAKGHTRADAQAALELVRDAGIAFRPTFVPFTPWSTLEDFEDILEWIEREDLIDCVDAVQLSIRLLVPPGSLLETLPALEPHLGPLELENFTRRWTHPDPRLDRLQRAITRIAHEGATTGEAAGSVFASIRRAAAAATEGSVARRVAPPHPALARGRVPRITEPWFC